MRPIQTCFALPRTFIGGILLVLVIPTAILAQAKVQLALNPNRPITQFAQDTWQAEDGLPQDVIKAVLQTDDGYVWIATQAGLVRFDGVQFRTFNKRNTPALAGNDIETLLERKNGELWIGTNGSGLTRRSTDGTFREFTADDGFTGNIVSALHEDADGHVWVGTAGHGLYRYNGRIFTRFTRAEGLPSSTVLALAKDTSGGLWVGTQEGLVHLNDGEMTDTWLSDHAITDLHQATREHLWVATEGSGLCRIPAADANPELQCMSRADGLSSNLVTAVLEDRSGALWIGTKGDGVNRLYKGDIDTYTTSDGLPNAKVSALYQDRENSLWIGTSGGGITRLHGTKFTTYSTSNGLSHDVVLTLLEDRTGTMWIGTDGGGLNRLSNGSITTITTADGLPSSHVYSLHETRDGRVWAGFLYEGACVVSGRTFDCYRAADGLSSNTVYAIYEDTAGNLWIGTDKGINRIRDGQITSFTQDDHLPHDWITAIHEDRDGVLWIGTFGGLAAYSNGSFSTYTTNDGLSSEAILTIHEDSEGILWIGTKGGGVCRPETQQPFRCYTVEDGLLSDIVLQVQTDTRGRLWTSHLKGISSVKKEQLHELDRGTRTQITPTHYLSAEANGGAQPAAWRSKNGHLWFATMSGAATINPARIPSNTVPPLVHMEEVLVEERFIDMSGSPSLPPESKDFEFHYTGLSFVAPEDVTFEYKLEGYDKEWVDAGSRRRAFYTNVPPGEYTFQVKAYNNAGVPSRSTASIGFVVEPYFYQTNWFYALCGLGIIFLSLTGNHLRVRRLRAQREKLSKLVAEQTKQLREREQELRSLNADLEEEVQRKVDTIMAERSRYEQELIAAKQKAEESARLKSNILMNMSHEIRTPLTSIMGFVDILSQGVREEEFEEFTNLIHQSGERLLQTVNSVLEMSELRAGSIDADPQDIDLTQEIHDVVESHQSEAEEKGITIEAKHDSTPVKVHVDPVHLQRSITNLISNAVKFSDRGTVTIRTYEANGEAVIEVEDEGQGIDKEFMPELFDAFKQESAGETRTHDGIGLGLTITRHFVELMDASIEVDSEKGEGSCFRIRIPRAHLQ